MAAILVVVYISQYLLQVNKEGIVKRLIKYSLEQTSLKPIITLSNMLQGCQSNKSDTVLI